MKLSWTTLFVTESTWTVGLSDGQPNGFVLLEEIDAKATGLTDLVAAAVKAAEAGAQTGPLIVGLPSSWCFGATLSSDGLLRRQRRQGLIYRLEEVLPVDAEAITADFIEGQEGIFGVAALNAKVKPLLDALESAGLIVAHFCPTSLLALDAMRGRETTQTAGELDSCYLIAADDDRVDVAAMHEGQLVGWRSVCADILPIEAEVRSLVDSSDGNPKMVALGLPDSVRTAINASLDQEAEDVVNPLEPTTRYAQTILLSGKPPLVDLRRDALSGQGAWQRVAKPATAAMAVLLLLLLSVGLVNTWQAYRYDRLAQQHADAQAELFRETFPGQRVPTAILSRFRSEAAKAKGLTGDNGDMPPTATILLDLQQVLSGLPDRGPVSSTSSADAMRFRILELRLEPDRLYLDGQARSHADADRLAVGLREQVAYVIEAPRTQNLSASSRTGRSATSGGSSGDSGGGGGGVGFTITGHREDTQP